MNKSSRLFNRSTLFAALLAAAAAGLMYAFYASLFIGAYRVSDAVFTGLLGLLAGTVIGYIYHQKRHSEHLLREVEHFAGIGTWSRDIETGAMTASDEVYRMLGYSPSEVQLSGEFLVSTLHKEDVVKFKKATEEGKKGKPYELELRHYRKDGTLVNLISRGRPEVNKDGTVTGISGIVLNISKLKQHEEELAEKQQIVNGILKATPDPLFLLDLNTSELVYYNDVMGQVLQNNPVFQQKYAELGVKLFRELVHPDDLPAYDAMNMALRQGANFYKINFRTMVMDNTYRWIEQRVLVYDKDAKGHINQVLVVSKDIHEQVLAEKRARKLNERIVRQNEATKKINAELDQFVYSVSHDLRAPLATILGLVNLSKVRSEPDELMDYMHKIGQSVEKLDGFIRDILNYSRNTRTEVESEPVLFKELLAEVTDNLRLVNNNDIKLEIALQEDGEYRGDRRRLSIILNNLLSNAFKYTDNTKTTKYVRVKLQASADGCNILIEDNGIGIDEGRQDKIFEMFYRGTDRSDGSGIGLYIVNEIVHKLQGDINITSTEGKGTTVHLTLPPIRKTPSLASWG